MTSRLTILVGGMIAAVPRHGGATWAVLQYLLGLRRLGHRVVFVEPLDAGALRPAGADIAASANAAYCAAVMDEVGLGDAWALLATGTRRTAGLAYAQIERIGRDADVLLNLSGTLDPELAPGAHVRAYVDIDPGFTQLWHDVDGIDMGLDGHTHFVRWARHWVGPSARSRCAGARGSRPCNPSRWTTGPSATTSSTTH